MHSYAAIAGKNTESNSPLQGGGSGNLPSYFPHRSTEYDEENVEIYILPLRALKTQDMAKKPMPTVEKPMA